MHDEPFACENTARRALVDACRSMDAAGLGPGEAAGVSVRWHRGGADGFLVTPSAPAHGPIGIDDIVWASMELADDTAPRILDGVHAPAADWRIHRELHASRPGAVGSACAGAVVLAQGPHATALACLPRIQLEGVPAFHPRVALAGGADIRCAPYATRGTPAQVANVLSALEGRRACLVAHQGLLAHAGTLASALELAREVETLARIYAQALQLGEPVVLDDGEMARVLKSFAARS